MGAIMENPVKKPAFLSLTIGIVVFAVGIILPYLGGRNFLWFTINCQSLFGSSGAIYLVSPLAMPVVLITWYLSIVGFKYGCIARKNDEIPHWYSKAGFILGIVNFVILGWQTVLLPIISWSVNGCHMSIM